MTAITKNGTKVEILCKMNNGQNTLWEVMKTSNCILPITAGVTV